MHHSKLTNQGPTAIEGGWGSEIRLGEGPANLAPHSQSDGAIEFVPGEGKPFKNTRSTSCA